MGGNLSRYNRLYVFFDIYQSKARSGYGVIPVSKAMVWQQKSYGLAAAKLWYAVKRIFLFTTQNEYSFEGD